MRYEIGNTPAVADIDLPFGRLDLVGIQLRVLGPIAGIEGVSQLVQFGLALGVGQQSGELQPIDRAVRWPDPMAYTVGHEPPLAAAERDGWRIVAERPEHLVCNQRKNVRTDAELAA